jgi:predicted HicB family RNase H-like nuclease
MMKYKGYVGKVEFDAEAGLLSGEVMGIRDVVTFSGKSVEEVELAFHESVDDYLDFCRSRGEQPNKPCSGKFVIRVDTGLHRQLEMIARASGKSLNAVVAEFLQKEADAAIAAPTAKHSLPVGRGEKHKRRRSA